ncbi:uncharacterized protein LOC144169909 isoform X2 [Haemaphysalis longicornis]
MWSQRWCCVPEDSERRLLTTQPTHVKLEAEKLRCFSPYDAGSGIKSHCDVICVRWSFGRTRSARVARLLSSQRGSEGKQNPIGSSIISSAI